MTTHVVHGVFELLTTFEITVPTSYNHATRLDGFRRGRRKEFYSYNDEITDANFKNATTKLVAGQRFLVKAFAIKETATSIECLGKIKAEGGRLTGAQGASLVYEQRKDELPKGKYYVSFDEKEALWLVPVDRYRGVPSMNAHLDGNFSFTLGHFEIGCGSDHVLLCFCDLPESSEV